MSTLVALGDSNTCPRAAVTLEQTWPSIVGPRRGFDVTLNKGIPGDTAAMMLDRFDADVIDQCADAVCIDAGMNDYYHSTVGAYELAMCAMIEKAQCAGINVTICTPNFVQDEAMKLAFYKVGGWCEAFQRLAAIEGVTLVDHYKDWALLYAVWSTSGQMARFQSLYAPDLPHIHRSAYGHSRVAYWILQHPNACTHA